MKHRIDLLLVTPSSRVKVYQSLSNEFAAIEPPVWSGLIAEFVRRHNHSVAMLDAEALGLSHAETAQRIVDANPMLVVFVIYGQQPSASTQCMPAGRVVCTLLNESGKNIPSLVMGTHASALPKRTLEEEPYSFVCEGEGPHTVLSLLEVLKNGSEDVSKVPGLWYRSEGQVCHNPAAPKIANLDEQLPGQAWDLLDMTRYRAHNWHCFDHIDRRQPYASLQTSLGCPYKCSFCCINAPFGSAGIRYWSPDNIIGQIDVLVNRYGVQNIKIPDEMFVLNEKHVMGICDRIIGRGYNLNIWAYARIDTVKERFLEKLKLAGFRWLGLGIESGSKHVRDGVAKGTFGEKDIVKIVKQIQSAGIYVGANYIFGLPDDTYQSMRETLDLAKSLNTEWANFYAAMAYPGSPLYATAVKQGWPLPEDWIGYSQHAYETLPLPTETLSGAEVLAFRDKAFDEYFTNPEYLKMISRKFGEKVVAHVQKMTGHQLNRKHKPAGRAERAAELSL